jgi:hypothetical protein
MRAPPDRCNHDNRPAAAPAHVRHREPRRADRRKQRLIERFLPFGIRGVDDTGTAREADAVDQDVEATKAADGFGDDRFNPGSRRQVSDHRQHAAVVSACETRELPGGCMQGRRAARADRDLAALQRQRLRDGEADPLAGAGDDGDLVGELEIHRASSSRRIRRTLKRTKSLCTTKSSWSSWDLRVFVMKMFEIWRVTGRRDR